MLKVGSCGIFMFYSLTEEEGTPAAVIFLTAYALSAFVIAYWTNIMWLDAVIFLPLMVLGIRRLVDGRGWYLYTFILALGIITNFYMGYMLCIFSVIYFVCYFLLISGRRKNIKAILLYVMSSLLAGMLSMWVLLPTISAMRGGKADAGIEDLLQCAKQFVRQLSTHEIIVANFCGVIPGGLPLIYTGIFVILVIVWWFLGNEDWKQKVGYILMIATICFSFKYRNLDYIWHGFRSPGGSPYRFSFLYTFLIAEMGWRGYKELSDMGENYGGKIKWLFACALLAVVVVIERKYFFEACFC